jgi:hypothetical protein
MPSKFAPQRRRRSPLPYFVALFVLLIGAMVWLASIKTEVPTQRIEQDVTNEALAH